MHAALHARFAIPLAVTLLTACSCNETRRKLVRAADTGYDAPKADKAPGATTTAAVPRLRLEGVARGFKQVTDLQWLPGEDGRLVVLQKEGVAYELTLKDEDGEWREARREKLFHVSVKVESEMGLLGWAFHPKFSTQLKESGAGLVYVNYNPGDGERLFTRVEEWRYTPSIAAADGVEAADPKAERSRTILEVDQPFQNHNGGQLAFGADGFLYVGLGDGGWRADPEGNAQNKGALLGKMLRIDVDVKKGAKKPYAIPADNPFVGETDARPEIWAWGLRNPWRFAFDQGRLIVADVGQDKWEEVHVVEKGDNLGWKIREGRHCFEPASGCQTDGLNEPVFEYGRDKGQSITGGYVYAGARLPGLKGRYVVGDFVSGRVWAMTLKGKGALVDAVELGTWPVLISTFGRSASGELFLADFAQGVLYQLVPEG